MPKHAMIELAITLTPRGLDAVMRVLQSGSCVLRFSTGFETGLRLPPPGYAECGGSQSTTGDGRYDLLLSEGYMLARPAAGGGHLSGGDPDRLGPSAPPYLTT